MKKILPYQSTSGSTGPTMRHLIVLLLLANLIATLGLLLKSLVSARWARYHGDREAVVLRAREAARDAAKRAHDLSLQQSCMHAQLLPNQVIYDDLGASSPDPAYRARLPLTADIPGQPPPQFKSPVYAAGPAFATELFHDFATGPWNAVCFLHERVSSNGSTLLVCAYVECALSFPQGNTDRSGEILSQRILHVAVLAPGPKLLNFYSCFIKVLPEHHYHWAVGEAMTTGDRFRFFTAAVDEADKSHFQIPYELNGKRGSLEAWVENTGDVVLRVDRGVLDRPPTNGVNSWYPYRTEPPPG